MNIAGEENRQFNLTELTPFTSYTVQVVAVNDIGTGPYSTPLTVKTLQDGELQHKTPIPHKACATIIS